MEGRYHRRYGRQRYGGRQDVTVVADGVSRRGSYASIGLSNTIERFVGLAFLGMVSALGLDGCVDFLLTGLLFDDVGLLNASDMQYVWSAGEAVDESRCRACPGPHARRLRRGLGAWQRYRSVLHRGRPYKVTVAYNARYDELIGVTFEKVAHFAPDDIETGANGFYDEAGGLSYDTTDNGVIFQVPVSQGGSAGNICTIKLREGKNAIVWTRLSDRKLRAMPCGSRFIR